MKIYFLLTVLIILVLFSLILVNYLRKCDCNQKLYPNITLISSGISFNITPDMYLFSSVTVRGCYLGITPLSADFIILGDVFLQHNTVIFNK